MSASDFCHLGLGESACVRASKEGLLLPSDG